MDEMSKLDQIFSMMSNPDNFTTDEYGEIKRFAEDMIKAKSNPPDSPKRIRKVSKIEDENAKPKMFHCPDCDSVEINQRSCETIVKSLNDQSPAQIKWDSEHQTYKCEDCGYETSESNDLVMK